MTNQQANQLNNSWIKFKLLASNYTNNALSGSWVTPRRIKRANELSYIVDGYEGGGRAFP